MVESPLPRNEKRRKCDRELFPDICGCTFKLVCSIKRGMSVLNDISDGAKLHECITHGE